MQPGSSDRAAQAWEAHQRGWALTPLEDGAPRLDRWQKRSAPGWPDLAEWAARRDLALRTGAASGVAVVRCAFDRAQRKLGEGLLATTVAARQPDGMVDLYYRIPKDEPLPGPTRRLQDIEVHGDGSFVLFPGSGGCAWEPGATPADTQIADLPEWIRKHCAPTPEPREEPVRPAPRRNTPGVRVPPNDEAAERALLGAALLGHGIKGAEGVAPAYFYHPGHALIWAAVLDAAKDAAAPDCVLIRSRLERDGTLAKAGGEAYLERCVGESPSAANLPEYARIVIERWKARELLRTGQQLAEDGMNPGTDPKAAAKRAREGLRAVDPRGRRAKGATAVEVEVTGFVEDQSSELWFARKFVLEHGSEIRYVGAWKCWMVWDGGAGVWRRDDNGAVMRLAKRTSDGILKEAAALLHSARGQEGDAAIAKAQARLKVAKHFRNARPLEHALRLAQSEQTVVASPDQWDATPWVLHCRNGLVDLRTGELGPHRREDWCTKSCAADYDPEAKAERWHAFLAEILPDPEVRAYLQRAVGYAATGKPVEQLFFLLVGPGGNGKRTSMGTVERVLGDYARTISDTVLVASQGANDDARILVDLHGVRAAFIHETPDDGRLAANRVKKITGSDRIEARRLYQEKFNFEPTHTIFVDTNSKPKVRDVSNGIWRRLRLVPFDVTVQKADRGLPDRLLEHEAAGILRWIVEGAIAYAKSGGDLGTPDAIADSTLEYRLESSDIADFLAHCVVADGNSFLPVSGIYKAYKAWSKANDVDEKKIPGQRTVTKRLCEMGYQYVREGDRKVRGFRGLALAGDAQQLIV